MGKKLLKAFGIFQELCVGFSLVMIYMSIVYISGIWEITDIILYIMYFMGGLGAYYAGLYWFRSLDY